MEIVYTDGNDTRFVELCGQLDAYLSICVGAEKQQIEYNQYNTLKDIHDVVLIIEDGHAAACGGFKGHETDAAEIKRVFTKDGYRNRGYAKAVIKALEIRAKEKGHVKLILETNVSLKAAVNMYSSLGFHIIKNYGPYVRMPESICMEKHI